MVRDPAKGERIRKAGGGIVDRVLADSFSVLTPSPSQTFAALMRKLVPWDD